MTAITQSGPCRTSVSRMSSPPANADSSDEALITTLVRNSRKITVVGASRDPGKAAHQVPAALLAMGYGITPVNPSG